MPTIQISKATTQIPLPQEINLERASVYGILPPSIMLKTQSGLTRKSWNTSQAVTAKDCSEFGCQSIVGTGPMASRTIPAPQRVPHMWTDRHKAQTSLILTPNLSSITFQRQVTMQTKPTLLLPRLNKNLSPLRKPMQRHTIAWSKQLRENERDYINSDTHDNCPTYFVISSSDHPCHLPGADTSNPHSL